METHAGFIRSMKGPTLEKNRVAAALARGGRRGPDYRYIFGQTFTFRTADDPFRASQLA